MRNILLTALLMVLFVLPSLAQNINVTPAQLNFFLEGGESTTTELVLKNTGNVVETFNLSIGDWKMKPNGDAETLPPNSTKNSCSEWFSLSESLVKLAPNQSKKVKVTIKVPNGKVGTNWSMIYVGRSEEQVKLSGADKALQLGAEVTTQVGIPVFQSTRTGGNYKAKVLSLKEIAKKKANRQFRAELSNQGNTVFEGKVFVTFSNIKTGQEIENPVHKLTVLPNSSRFFDFIIPSTLPKGDYTMAVVLDYNEDAELEGKQAQLSIK